MYPTTGCFLPKVRLTGGEPTIRGDFERILEAGFQGNVEDKG